MVGLWVLLLIAAALFQESIIFPRWRVPAHEYAQATPSDAQLLALDTDAGIVPAWLFAGEAGAGLVVILHGNGVVIDAHLQDARRIAARGWHVLLPEYRGYGRAAGSPTEASITSDVMAFIDRVQALPTVDADRLVLYGRSIGTCVAGVLAPGVGADGLILQTPPLSVRAMAAGYFVPGGLIRHPLDSAGALASMDPVPTLVIEHGQDGLIPSWQVKRIAEVTQATHVVVNGGHNAYAAPADRRLAHESIDALLERLEHAEPDH